MKKLFFLILISLTISVYGQFNDMVQIIGGTFLMGSPENEEGRFRIESPQHQVTISTFYMGKYEVTQEEYQKIMGTNPGSFKGSNLPVEQVSWFDAIEYCNKRSVKEGLNPAYTINGNIVSWNRDADGYRLPTEAEWEYACRAETITPFYSGTSVDTAGWHSGNSSKRTQPVGEKQPNSWGLYDMHGNVLEWCWDWFDNYTNEEQVNPTGAIRGTERVYRGGSCLFESHLLRSAYRFGNHPNLRTFFLGFRVARNIVIL